MIVRIEGRLEDVEGNRCVVALQGVGLAREVMLPSVVAEELRSRVGETVSLHTIEYFEAGGQGSHLTPRLIGFSTLEQRRFFELFTTVKGLGARKALKAIAAPVGEIAAAVAARDTKALQRLPEVGKRLAETIVAELHGKVERFALDVGASAGPGGGVPAGESKMGALGGAGEQAVAALVRLGEQRPNAEAMVLRALQGMGAEERESADADAILAAAFALGS